MKEPLTLKEVQEIATMLDCSMRTVHAVIASNNPKTILQHKCAKAISLYKEMKESLELKKQFDLQKIAEFMNEYKFS